MFHLVESHLLEKKKVLFFYFFFQQFSNLLNGLVYNKCSLPDTVQHVFMEKIALQIRKATVK